MKLDDKTYKKYLKFANIITQNGDLAQDVLNDSLLKIIEKGYEDCQITDNLVFIIIRNTHLSTLKIENKYTNLDNNNLPQLNNLLDDVTEDKSIKDLEFQTKLDAISDVYSKLNIFDQQLLYLVAISKLTISQIAKQTQIERHVINYRFKKIKDKIKQYKDGKIL
jgi:DNA-directed RNA polymerase specialized sigma24 family protein